MIVRVLSPVVVGVYVICLVSDVVVVSSSVNVMIPVISSPSSFVVVIVMLFSWFTIISSGIVMLLIFACSFTVTGIVMLSAVYLSDFRLIVSVCSPIVVGVSVIVVVSSCMFVTLV